MGGENLSSGRTVVAPTKRDQKIESSTETRSTASRDRTEALTRDNGTRARARLQTEGAPARENDQDRVHWQKSKRGSAAE
jgi:hypothetical protein